jgi:hypothetical protein
LLIVMLQDFASDLQARNKGMYRTKRRKSSCHHWTICHPIHPRQWHQGSVGSAALHIIQKPIIRRFHPYQEQIDHHLKRAICPPIETILVYRTLSRGGIYFM